MFPNGKPAMVAIRVRSSTDAMSGEVSLPLPKGWTIAPASIPVNLAKAGEEVTVSFQVTPPKGSGSIEVSPSLWSGGKAWSYREDVVDYPHIPMQVVLQPARVRLSPLDARLFWHEGGLAQAHYVQGNYDEALEWVRSAVRRNESIRYNLRTLIATLVALGKEEEAAEAAQHLLRIQPEFRLGRYAKHCPFLGPILDTWLARLRSAGLPE